MNTYKKIHDGINQLSNLTRSDQAWVQAKLRMSLRPQEAQTMLRLHATVQPKIKPISVFLSHNSADKPLVRRLYRYLSDMGLRVWLDEAELNAGDSLVDTLSEAVYKVDFIVAVISSTSITSKWVKKELAWAMTREIKGKRVSVIPIKIDGVEMPSSISDKLYLDFSSTKLRAKNKPILLSSILNQKKK